MIYSLMPGSKQMFYAKMKLSILFKMVSSANICLKYDYSISGNIK